MFVPLDEGLAAWTTFDLKRHKSILLPSQLFQNLIQHKHHASDPANENYHGEQEA